MDAPSRLPPTVLGLLWFLFTATLTDDQSEVVPNALLAHRLLTPPEGFGGSRSSRDVPSADGPSAACWLCLLQAELGHGRVMLPSTGFTHCYYRRNLWYLSLLSIFFFNMMRG